MYLKSFIFRGCGFIFCLLIQNIFGFGISIAKHEGDRLMRCDAVQSGTNLTTFRKKLFKGIIQFEDDNGSLGSVNVQRIC